jgi:hypothetical protein
MTQEAYFDMCEMLGSEPIESEIPVELSDFPYEVRTCFNIYSLLRDNWDSMAGRYLGKDYGNIFEYFKMYLIDPEDYLLYTSLIQNIDAARSNVISSKQKAADVIAKNNK